MIEVKLLSRESTVRVTQRGRDFELAVFRDDGGWGLTGHLERADALDLARWILGHQDSYTSPANPEGK